MDMQQWKSHQTSKFASCSWEIISQVNSVWEPLSDRMKDVWWSAVQIVSLFQATILVQCLRWLERTLIAPEVSNNTWYWNANL